MEGGDEHMGLKPLELKGVSQSMDLSKKQRKVAIQQEAKGRFKKKQRKREWEAESIEACPWKEGDWNEILQMNAFRVVKSL